METPHECSSNEKRHKIADFFIRTKFAINLFLSFYLSHFELIEIHVNNTRPILEKVH